MKGNIINSNTPKNEKDLLNDVNSRLTTLESDFNKKVVSMSRRIWTSTDAGVVITTTGYKMDKWTFILVGADNKSHTPVFTLIRINTNQSSTGVLTYDILELGLKLTYKTSGDSIWFAATQYSNYDLICPYLGLVDFTFENKSLS